MQALPAVLKPGTTGWELLQTSRGPGNRAMQGKRGRETENNKPLDPAVPDADICLASPLANGHLCTWLVRGNENAPAEYFLIVTFPDVGYVITQQMSSRGGTRPVDSRLSHVTG